MYQKAQDIDTTGMNAITGIRLLMRIGIILLFLFAIAARLIGLFGIII